MFGILDHLDTGEISFQGHRS